MLLETFAEVLERTKVLRAQQKRVDGSGQQYRSAFDITDQRDFFLPISSDPTWIPWYVFEKKLCADGFLWRRKPDIFW